MAAAIRSELGLEAVLLGGHNGVFQVSANGQLVYDNGMKCGPLPRPEEILPGIRALMEEAPPEG